MFLKLVKTDFKYHSRSFFMVMMSVLLANVLMLSSRGVVLSSKGNNVEVVKNFLFAVAIIFLAIAIFGTVFMIIKVFNNKCVSSESYLTYSLPVKRYCHIWSNLVVSGIWGTITAVSAIFSATLWWGIWYGKESLFENIRGICKMFFSSGFDTFAFIFSSMVGTISGTFLIYLCISVVNTGVLKHKPLISGVLIYSAIFYLQTTLSSQIIKFCDKKFNLDCSDHYMAITLLITSSICIIFGVVYYILLLHNLNKKLEVN